MSVATIDELTRYRWSSEDEDDRLPIENPSTGTVITVVQGGGAIQMNAAVEAAHRTFAADWRWRPPKERGQFLLSCADVLHKHADELASLLSLENGKPIADARQNDVEFLIGVFRFFGSIIDKLPTGDFFDATSLQSSAILITVNGSASLVTFR